MSVNTLDVAKRLEATGLTENQAEEIAQAVHGAGKDDEIAEIAKRLVRVETGIVFLIALNVATFVAAVWG